MLCIALIVDAKFTFAEIKKKKKLATLGDLLALLPKSSEGYISISYKITLVCLSPSGSILIEQMEFIFFEKCSKL